MTKSLKPMATRVLSMMFASCLLGACTDTASMSSMESAQRDMTYARAMPTVRLQDWDSRGTVVSSSDRSGLDLSALPPGSMAWKMVYRSISGTDGRATQVSGAVFIPPGQPPPGGWPLIGYAHGTVGVTANCGPTGDSRLFGDIVAVAIQLSQGYAVAFTDYAGLGPSASSGSPEPTKHAYLEPKSAAFNVIDAVAAAMTIAPQVSRRWVALGASQGGAAAWATAEYYPLYGRGNVLLGAAALVPALNLSGLVTSAENMTLTAEQLGLYPYVITGLRNVDVAIDPRNYLHGTMLGHRDALISCARGDRARKGELALGIDGSMAQSSSEDAVATLVGRLESYALPQRATAIPILAIYGGSDDTVLPQWTEVAMGRGCALGEVIQRVRLENQGHSLDPGAALGKWVTDRFAGVDASGNC